MLTFPNPFLTVSDVVCGAFVIPTFILLWMCSGSSRLNLGGFVDYIRSTAGVNRSKLMHARRDLVDPMALTYGHLPLFLFLRLSEPLTTLSDRPLQCGGSCSTQAAMPKPGAGNDRLVIRLGNIKEKAPLMQVAIRFEVSLHKKRLES